VQNSTDQNSWQMDHMRLDIAVDGQEVEQPCRPWLTVVMAIGTRMIIGYQVSHTPPTNEQMSQFLDELLVGKSGEDKKEGN
jgi:transposase InsO family protein